CPDLKGLKTEVAEFVQSAVTGHFTWARPVCVRKGSTGNRCTEGFRSGVCPLWVLSRRKLTGALCLLVPYKRTSNATVGRSGWCHKRTHASQHIGSLFDHLVGAGGRGGGTSVPASHGG